MFQIIDYPSKTYIDGGPDTKNRAEYIKEKLRKANLKEDELAIIEILPGEKPSSEFTKTSIYEIEIEVNKRILQVQKTDTEQ